MSEEKIDTKLKNKNDKMIIMIKDENKLPFHELTGSILACCFEVMRELGPGFLEKLYKNALLIAMRQKGLQVDVEKPYEVIFRDKIIGKYYADLVVDKKVILEIKCCNSLVNEHQAQLFNYLTISGLPIGLLVNFRRKKIEWKRLQNNAEYFEKEDIFDD